MNASNLSGNAGTVVKLGGVLFSALVFCLLLHMHSRRVYADGAAHIQAKWDRAERLRKTGELAALNRRMNENETERQRQLAVNSHLQKEYQNEIAILRAGIARAGRLHVGPGFCGGAAAPPDAAGAGRSNAGDSATRLLSEAADGDIKALMQEAGEIAAAGRACQKFVRDNGMGD